MCRGKHVDFLMLLFTLCPLLAFYCARRCAMAQTFDQDLTIHESTTALAAGFGEMKWSTVYYFSKNGMKTSSSDGKDNITWLDKGKTIIIDNNEKTYTEVSIGQLQEQIKRGAASMEESYKAMGEAVEQMKVDVTENQKELDEMKAKQARGEREQLETTVEQLTAETQEIQKQLDEIDKKLSEKMGKNQRKKLEATQEKLGYELADKQAQINEIEQQLPNLKSKEELEGVKKELTARIEDTQKSIEAGKENMDQLSRFASYTVTREGPGERIAGYATEKYLIKGPMGMEMTLWVAPDLKIPETCYDVLKARTPQYPMFDMAKIYDEVRKVKAFPVKSVFTMRVANVEARATTLVGSVIRGPIPASTFEVPAGYRLRPSSLR